jgi:DNA photolyase
VVFGLTDDSPEANLRHCTFMLEGLKDVQQALEKRGIKMVVREGSPEEETLDAGKDASLVITDRGYLRPQKKWREKIAGEAGCLVIRVESDVVVTVELASDKQKHAARTRSLRQGALHVSRRPGAQGEARTIRGEGRKEDRRFGLTPEPRRILPSGRLGQDSGYERG